MSRDGGTTAKVRGLPLTRATRAEVLAGAKAKARKFFTPAGSHEEKAGDYPTEGTPTQPIRIPGGSQLPVMAASRQLESAEEQWTMLYRSGQVIPPPYDLWTLVCHVEESDALGPLVDTYATNMVGYGYRLDPLFPTRDEEGNPIDPPPEAVAEREDLELFLQSVNVEHGILGLLDLASRDRESTGCGYIEVLRDQAGQVAGAEHAPSYTMRLGKLSQPVLVENAFRHPVTGELVTLRRWRRFRTFVQIRGHAVAFFKQFGDPRFVNRKTGEYRDESWGVDELGNALDGTEIVYRRIYAPHTPYGVPRWVGASPHVKAGRQAGELLVSWFLYAPIGAKLAMIAGGKWNSDSYERATSKIDDMARGVENAWSIVCLEADPNESGDLMEDSKGTPPRIGLEDLAYELPATLYQGDDNLLDGSFRRIARMFKLPPVYWGGSDDYSRAAVNTARATTEEQVFVPERRAIWTRWFNSELLPQRGVNFWAFELNGANTSDDSEIPVAEIAEHGGASPNALIGLWNAYTGQEVAPIAEPWGDRPLALTSLLVGAGMDPNLPLSDVLGAEEGGPELDEEGNPIAPAAAGAGSRRGPVEVDDAQKTALNGAQVQAALEVVQAVPAGGLTRAMAHAMLVEFFNLSADAANAILADVESLEPPPPPTLPPGFGDGNGEDGDDDAAGDEDGGQDGGAVPARKRLRPGAVMALEQLADRLERDLRTSNPGWFA